MDEQQRALFLAESTIIGNRKSRNVYISTRTGLLQRQMYGLEDAMRALIHNRYPNLDEALRSVARMRDTLDLLEREAKALAQAWANRGGEPDD